MSIDSQINAFFKPISEAISSVVFYPIPLSGEHDLPLILLWLALAAVFFTFYLGCINIRYFGRGWSLLFSKGLQKSPDGEISQFQALMTCLSGTVGLGNIASVGVAISYGGPGAAFWMTVMGFLGMSSKFAEVSMGVKYRVRPDPENPKKTAGGPMYYIRAAFEKRNLPLVGKVLAMTFCAFCVAGAIGGGNMFQANQVFEQLITSTGGDQSPLSGYGWAVGLLMAFLVAVVIFGGLTSIAAVSSKLVPVMALVYVIMGLVVIGLNIHALPDALVTIFRSAFSLDAGVGAGIGAFMASILNGVKRAAFSNESGLGSAAIVQSTTNTDGPVGTGFVAMLGPFIDTIIICNITALVIVITGAYQASVDIEAVELTSRAFTMGFENANYILTLCVVLFAYSTMIAWYYNGAICMKYMFGENKTVDVMFKGFYCLCVVIGSSVALTDLINFTDAVFLAMAFPNIIGLYLLAPEIKKDIKEYVQALKNKS